MPLQADCTGGRGLYAFILFFSASQPSKPYLSTLSQTELEKVGLKAVAAGANPQKLQQAFATAQLQGDWSKLEKLISDELGVAAINPAETGLAAAAQSTGAFSRVFFMTVYPNYLGKNNLSLAISSFYISFTCHYHNDGKK